MLSLSINPNYVILNDIVLIELYERSHLLRKSPWWMVGRYMAKEGSFSAIPLPFRYDILSKVNKKVVSMMC